MTNFFKKIKTNASFIVPWLILGLAIVIFGSGLTYAYFDFVLNSQEESSLKVTGTDFDISLYGNNISVSNLTPIYDEYYETQAFEYAFDIENNSRRVPACYSISFDITSISPGLISSNFKWKLVNLDTSAVTDGNFSGASNPIVTIKTNNDLIAHVTDHYKIYIWLSYSGSDQNNTKGASFSSNLKLTALSGQCPVDIRKNKKLNNVRYIKDCMNGNTVNLLNSWNEITAIEDGVNLAINKTVTSTGTIHVGSGTWSLAAVVDGKIDNFNNDNAYINETGLQCITVDLGTTYNLDEIAVWHAWADGRTYYSNTTYVSNDNITWTPVIANTAAESSQGKSVSVDGSNATVTPIFRVQNLVANGSFESGLTGWSVSGNTSKASTTSTTFAFGANSYMTTGTSSVQENILWLSDTSFYQTGHIYYYSQYIKNLSSVNEYSHFICNGNSIELTQGYSANFVRSSGTTTCGSTTDKYLAMAWVANAGNGNAIYADGIMVIDLTVAFGAGKEPTKAWCDANLNYFDGSQNMYLPLN